MKIGSTKDIAIPTSPLDRVIGQDEAVAIARIAAKQRRHLLLVGAPGTGKSMVAQAVASLLPKPKFEVSVLHNPENPERPFVEITPAEKAKERKQAQMGRVVDITDVPVSVAERLGYRCRRCGSISPSGDFICPSCGANKYSKSSSPFDDLLFSAAGEKREDKVRFTWKNGEFEALLYVIRLCDVEHDEGF